MLKDIPTNYFPQSPLGGVLIKHKTLQKNRSLRRQEEQARQRAKKLIKDAQKEAQMLQEEACREGFQQGVIIALKQVATYLSNSNLTLLHWQLQLDKQVREMLAASVNHPETLLLVLDEWLSELSSSNSSVNVVLPEIMKVKYSDAISQVVRDKGVMVHIGYHHDANVVFRCGEDIAEFSPTEFTEMASRRILMRNLPDLKQDCYRLSHDALALFIEYCQGLSSEAENHRSDKEPYII
ncbi:TPA: hypothetical protein O3H02_004259 [Salmonella enterica subsp. enterica serovar Saintpaul str. CFSAN004144]|nr:hypothetical protein [Salmonella enterica subsp. enterica serovar Saintpaul str. CFSAN004144]